MITDKETKGHFLCRCETGGKPPAGQGKLAAVFGDGLWLTDPDRDVGRTKPYELCLAGGERALGPLSPYPVD